MMFISLCATYNSSDPKGPVRFTSFLIELFESHGVHIPVGQRKKRRVEAIASEEPSIGMAELKEAIMSLRMEFDIRMTTLEEQSGCHMTMLQEIKSMLIQMHRRMTMTMTTMMIRSLEFRLSSYFIIFLSKTLVGLLLLGICLYVETCLNNLTCF